MSVTSPALQYAWRQLQGGSDGSGQAAPHGYARRCLHLTGVPGMAIAVVCDDDVLFSGCGTRDVDLGERAPIDSDTVFPLASLSKPITSTVMAYWMAEQLAPARWSTPIRALDPSYDFQVGVTLAALLAHRSGLVEHAGDLLEDLGFERDYILQHITKLPTWPPEADATSFACPYQYTNFGYSAAAFAFARELGTEWEDLGRAFFARHGMTRTSYRYEEALARDNVAKPYQRLPAPRAGSEPLPRARSWVPPTRPRRPDAQSPAGGVTSTLRDLSEWMRLNLRAARAAARGVSRTAEPTDAFYANIRHTQAAYQSRAEQAGYGFGWASRRDEHMGVVLSHSGAFALGAATCVQLLPADNVGIVALTNGQPIGVPEAICRQFLWDLTGHPQRTAFELTLQLAATAVQDQIYPVPAPDFSRPATHPPTPVHDPSSLVGEYVHDHYGAVTISGTGSLSDPFLMRAGRVQHFPLRAYAALTFTFQTSGENANGLSGVRFIANGAGAIDRVEIYHFTMVVRDSHGNLAPTPAVFLKQSGAPPRRSAA